MPFFIPRGRCVYAVGDVHGRADLLLGLLSQISAHAENLPATTIAEVVMLGDYIDRGWQSAQVLDLLAVGFGPRLRLKCLRGNHEEMMRAALIDPYGAMAERWLDNGGEQTLASYGLRRDQIERLPSVLPTLHRRLLDTMGTSYRCGSYYFVHAGVDPRRPLDDQDEQAQLWIRDAFLNHSGPLEMRVVHGHTIVDAPQITPYRIAVDTGAYRTNCLTCVVLQGQDVGILQQSEGLHRSQQQARGSY